MKELTEAETARVLAAVSAYARVHPLGPARFAWLALLSLQYARLNPWPVPDDPLDEWPVVPTAYFGAADRGPATATAERCALAVEHPNLAPPIDVYDTELLSLAVATATHHRVRFWDAHHINNPCLPPLPI